MENDEKGPFLNGERGLDRNGKVQQKRSVFRQILLGLMANFSSLAPSMSLGFSAIAVPVLKSESNPYRMTDDQTSWVASIASIATPIGCFLSGPISDRFGRKSALCLINVVGFVGWIIVALAYQFPERQYPILLAGRIVTGLSTGLASMPASVYMAEVSSMKLRPVFTTWSAIFFSLGVLVVYALGFILKDDWGTTAAITAGFPCIGMVLAVFILPESPSWLISKNRTEAAKINMCKIFGSKQYTTEINDEVEALIANRERNKIKSNCNNSKSFGSQIAKKLKLLMRPTCYKPFVLVLAYFFFQQFSGTFVVVFYAIDIVREAGVQMDPYVAIVMIAATRLVGAILVSFISRVYGRRPQSITSGAGMTICMVVLALYLYLLHDGALSIETQTHLKRLPLILIVIYFFTSTLGFLTMPFAMAAECFPAKIRGTATGLITCIAYIFNFIIVKLYPSMVAAMGSYGVFCFYGVMSLIGTVFIITCLPETKGKSLQEIEEYFEGKKARIVNEKEQETIKV